MSCLWQKSLLLLCVMFSAASVFAADNSGGSDLLVFITAFAPGDEGAIHACHLNVKTGELKPIHRTTGIEHPFFMALSPDRKYLYAIDAPGEFSGKNNEFVSAWALDGQTGRMKLLNRQSTHGTAACYVDVDATGKTVLVANYTTGSVVSLPVQKDGSLGEAAAFVQHVGSSVNKERQGEPHAHCFVISPDNRHAYAADLGIDKIQAYKLDPGTAKITPAAQPFVRTPPGTGPRHLTFHPDGKKMYVINELLNSVTHFGFSPDSGMLVEHQTISTIPDDFKGVTHCADLKITPNGKFLYGTNRGHDSIAAYRIADDGALTLLEIEPSLGNGPQNLAITPDGQWLICANMPGNNVVVFRIDAEKGLLSPVGKPLTSTSPSCIRIY